MNITPVIAIIGAGHMSHSLLSGLIKDGYPATHLWASDPNQEKLTVLQETLHIHTTTNNAAAAMAATVIIFAIKPAVLTKVAIELASIIKDKKPLIISIAAGIRAKHIAHLVGEHIAIVRTMPNTPALIGCGATALFANTHVSHEQRNLAETILRAVGSITWFDDEAAIDTVTALSGSGPAYFFLIMEAMQQAAVQLGLPKESARFLTLQTALGAARMAIESGYSLEELRKRVTSPGGTTEKAISVLEEQDIRGILQKTLEAAKLRSEELALILGKDN